MTASAIMLGLALLLLLVALLVCWLLLQLVRQGDRLARRLDRVARLAESALEATPRASAPVSRGHRPGNVLQDFELPNQWGGNARLTQYHGQRVLLAFVDPSCPHSPAAIAALATLPAEGDPRLVLVSSGDREANLRLMREHDIRGEVLLQESHEVAELLRVGGTPMGYLVDEQRLVARPLAMGGRALLALAEAPNAATLSDAFTPVPPTRRVPWNGLPAGARAPDFRLPALGGGEHSLAEHLGETLLLVFVDPACAACIPLLGKLERLHRRSAALRVLMVSRGDPDASRAMVSRHRLTFPVLLQQGWEVSRSYRILSTPVGFLIDERGTIVDEAAEGADAVSALGSRARRGVVRSGSDGHV